MAIAGLGHRLPVLLGDLRHHTIGCHSPFTPLALGLIAAHARVALGAAAPAFHFEVEPVAAFRHVETARPRIVALANYMWNAEVSYHLFAFAKRLDPQVICVAGGPDFPSAPEERRDHLARRPAIDVFVLGEGEVTFSDIAEKVVQGATAADLRQMGLPGTAALDSSGRLVSAPPRPRLTDLGVIPSPYLDGTLDRFLDGTYFPFIESARGCPYSCSYCAAADSSYNKVAVFTVERIVAEIEYFARRMSMFPEIPLAIADSNFGMLKRDEEIAAAVKSIRDRHGWPTLFDVSTGKAQFERIMRVKEMMGDGLVLSLSVQSLNQKTLAEVKRKNLEQGRFAEVYEEFRRKGIRSYSDLILPLPHETKESFFDGLRAMFNTNVETFTPFTTMMLKGTELYSQEARQAHELVTRFRVLPRQFGTYDGRKCFEVEEVCVATATLSFDDYLECRGISLLIKAFSSPQFDTLARHCHETDLDRFDLLLALARELASGRAGELSRVYADFISDSRTELFDSPAAVQDFYGMEENYQALLEGRLGDNLIRRHSGRIVLDHGAQAIALSYALLLDMLRDRDPDTIAAIRAAREWVMAARDVSAALRLHPAAFEPAALSLAFDVPGWYAAGHASAPLVSMPGAVTLSLVRDRVTTAGIVERFRGVYGGDDDYWMTKLFTSIDIRTLWRNGQAEGEQA